LAEARHSSERALRPAAPQKGESPIIQQFNARRPLRPRTRERTQPVMSVCVREFMHTSSWLIPAFPRRTAKTAKR
jgi:hypothetical protein